MEGNVDVFAVVAAAQTNGGGLGDGAEPVGMLDAASGGPGQALPVGKDGSREGAAIVAAPADEHDAQLGHFQVGLDFESVRVRGGLNDDLELC